MENKKECSQVGYDISWLIALRIMVAANDTTSQQLDCSMHPI